MEEEINLREIVKGVWRRKIVIIILTFIAMLVGILYSQEKIEIPVIEKEKAERVMYAKTSFTVVQTENYRINDNTSTTYQHIIKSTHNMERVIEKFELDMEPEELAASLWIRRVDYSDIIELGVTNEELLDKSIEILDDLIVMLNNELKNTYSINDIYVVQKPIIVDLEKNEDVNEIEDSQTNAIKSENSDSSVKKIIVITLAGVIIGCVVVIGLEVIDGSIKNENQIINNLKINNLATITSKQSCEKNEEEFRKIKLSIKDNKSILITSLGNNNRKGEIVDGVTDLYSKYGKKVALIDITEEHLDIYNVKLEKEFKYTKTKLPDSDDNLVEILETEKIKYILENLNKKFDIIVVNANDISKSINSLTISKFVDSTICIVEVRKTKMKLLEKTIRNLENIHSKLLGTIITEN